METRRDWWTALRAGGRWMANPVSEMGAANAFRLSLSLARPEIFETYAATRNHPVGRRLLRERPDLGAALADMGHLGSLPEGSLGRSYHAFMSHPDTVPGYLLAGLAYEGGYFEALPWEEDLKWMLERQFNTHDLMHVVAGYGADLAGEGMLIFFSLGAMLPRIGFRAASLTPFGALVRLSRPPIPRRRWRAYLQEALDRAQAMGRHQPPSCIDWESLLPLPIEDARRAIGLPPLREPEMCSADWGSTWLMRRIESGQGQSESENQKLASYRAAVEAGVPVRALMRCPMAVRMLIGQRAVAGTPRSELMRMVESVTEGREAA